MSRKSGGPWKRFNLAIIKEITQGQTANSPTTVLHVLQQKGLERRCWWGGGAREQGRLAGGRETRRLGTATALWVSNASNLQQPDAGRGSPITSAAFHTWVTCNGEGKSGGQEGTKLPCLSGLRTRQHPTIGVFYRPCGRSCPPGLRRSSAGFPAFRPTLSRPHNGLPSSLGGLETCIKPSH